MSSEDFKSQALNSPHDFYDLLGLSEGAGEGEIRRAYRQTARKYHPDKIRNDASAIEKEDAAQKFHLIGVAYEVLQDPAIKELYDNARLARRQKAERHQAYAGDRKRMIDELERRERESGTLKRKPEEQEAIDERERKLRRLAEEGRKRREERAERMRKEAEEAEREEQERRNGPAHASTAEYPKGREVTDADRTITLRFPQDDAITTDILRSRFERFGAIDEVLSRDKKIKIDGQKHRQLYTTAIINFKSVVGAHAAISDFSEVAKSLPGEYGIFEAVGWVGGKEPECVPKPKPDTPQQEDIGIGLKKVPPTSTYEGIPEGTQMTPHEIMMIRLKNAQRKRDEAKRRRAEGAAAPATPQENGQVSDAAPKFSGLSKSDPTGFDLPSGDEGMGVPLKRAEQRGSEADSRLKEESSRQEERERLIEEIKRQDAAEDAAANN